MKLVSRIGTTLAFVALVAQPAGAVTPVWAYQLEMRIVSADLPRTGERSDCRVTVDVVRVVRARSGFQPTRMEVTIPCGVPGQWRATADPSSWRVSTAQLRVGTRFSASLRELDGGRLLVLPSTFRVF